MIYLILGRLFQDPRYRSQSWYTIYTRQDCGACLRPLEWIWKNTEVLWEAR